MHTGLGSIEGASVSLGNEVGTQITGVAAPPSGAPGHRCVIAICIIIIAAVVVTAARCRLQG